MSVDKEQIKNLLGSGLTPDVVSTAVGCTPAYITQLMAEEEFSSEVISLRAKRLTAQNDRDTKVDSLEDKLLAKTHQMVDDNSIYKPLDIARLLVAVNKMTRRGVPATDSVVVQNRVVNLQMPTQVIQHFTLNTNSEVVEVGEQTLVTMPTSQLLEKLAKERGKEDGSKYLELQKFLPGSGGGLEFGTVSRSAENRAADQSRSSHEGD